ncbi:SulP family inorganic anion transporter [Nannocystaceae bacterium ST9]
MPSPLRRSLARNLPILDWLPSYRRRDLPADLAAGLTVAVMLIPQAMAYALLAGLPPIHGLYASTLPLLGYAVFGSSRQLAVGPVAMDSLLVAVAVAAIATVGSEAYLAAAVLLAAMVGLLQVTMGAVRLGFLVNFLSAPVISGFTSAAALVIGLSQLPALLGLDLGRDAKPHELLIRAASQIAEVSLPTLALSAGALIGLLVLQWRAPRFPRALAVVVVGTSIVWIFGLDQRGVAIVGEVPAGLPIPALPHFDLATIEALAPAALAIALLSFMEAISVGKAMAATVQRDPSGRRPRIDANQELIGLGVANLLGSLVRGYPIAGGLSRTAVAAQAGARTGMAGIVTATIVVLTLLFLTPLFHDLPKAVLAAIIVSAVAGLVDVGMVRRLWKVERSELAVLALTFMATLTIGIVEGIGVGVALSLAVFVVRATRPHTAVLGRLPGSRVYRNLARFPEAVPPEGVIVVRVDAQFYFGNVDFLERTIDRLLDEASERGRPARAIVIDASSINRLDSSADAALLELHDELRERGVSLYFAGVKGPVRDMMDRSGLHARVGADHFALDLDEAVLAAQQPR